MKPQRLLISNILGVILIASSNMASADDHPCRYTFHINEKENTDDAMEDDCEECERRERCYQQLHKYDEDGDPTYELEYDTRWPAQREDFSDILFR